MIKRRARFVSVLVALTAIAAIIAGCASGGTELPQGQTISTFTPAPTTATPVPSDTATVIPSDTPIPSPTSIEGPYIVANLGVRVREGPTLFHKEVGLLKVGDTAKVLGRVAGTDV